LGGSPSKGDRLSVVSDVVGDSRDAGVADGSGLRGAVAQEQDGHGVGDERSAAVVGVDRDGSDLQRSHELVFLNLRLRAPGDTLQAACVGG
ncbi:unnamed protein product, partial [Plutella xylostella]